MTLHLFHHDDRRASRIAGRLRSNLVAPIPSPAVVGCIARTSRRAAPRPAQRCRRTIRTTPQAPLGGGPRAWARGRSPPGPPARRPARCDSDPQECYLGPGNIFDREPPDREYFHVFLGSQKQFLGSETRGGSPTVGAHLNPSPPNPTAHTIGATAVDLGQFFTDVLADTHPKLAWRTT
jgi:hypothetical protein